METEAPRRFLIVYGSSGSGHRHVAEALQEQISEADPGAEVMLCDFYEALVARMFRGIPAAYGFMTRRALPIYDIAWRLTDGQLVSELIARLSYRGLRRRIGDVITSSRADVVVVVHPLYISRMLALARKARGDNFALVTLVTDPVNPHASWAPTANDACLVPSVEAANRMRKTGFACPEPVLVNYPVRKRFWEVARRDATRRQLGIRPSETLVLLQGGGFGAGRIIRYARRLRRDRKDWRLLVVPGSNRRLRRQLLKLSGLVATPDPEQHIATLMAAADVVIGKGGPATIYEALATNTPIVITDEVGRQEKGNGKLARRLGIGYECKKVANIERAVCDAISRDPIVHEATNTYVSAGEWLAMGRWQ